MSSPRVCRFCRAAISGNFVSLFGKLSAARDWPCRISELLLVRVASEDGLPPQMCRKCCRRIEAHEKSQSDLSNFRKQVRESYQAPQPVRGPLKRTKVTSSDVDVTPQTAKARPPAKKHSSGKRTLDFGQSDVGKLYAIKILYISSHDDTKQEELLLKQTRVLHHSIYHHRQNWISPISQYFSSVQMHLKGLSLHKNHCSWGKVSNKLIGLLTLAFFYSC